MVKLSTDPRTSRILIEAFYRGVFDEVLSIICVLMNSQYLFIYGYKNFEDRLRKKLSFIDPSGDLITFLNVYDDYQ